MNEQSKPDQRLDRCVTALGLARSRTQAHELILAGLVSVDGVAVHKPSALVGSNSAILVTPTPEQRWVGRGAQKLEGALVAWADSGLSVQGKTCLDVGASTGGFTQVLLAAGAHHVIALDVGHGQLVAGVANDERVTEMSGTNIRDTSLGALGGAVDVIVADLSFIPLAKVVPSIAPLVKPVGDVILLVKPQFEVGPNRVGRNGIVRSAQARRDAVVTVVHALYAAGLGLVAMVPSVIVGGGGNREYLVWARPVSPGMMDQSSAQRLIDDVLRREHE